MHYTEVHIIAKKFEEFSLKCLDCEFSLMVSMITVLYALSISIHKFTV